MAKNKSKGQKPKNVFHVANSKTLKAKNKAKPVTTNLKKLKVLHNDKVDVVDKVFVEVYKVVQQPAKHTPSECQKKHPIASQPKDQTVNVDETASLFSNL